MINYENFAAVLVLIKHYDPEYKHDNFTIQFTDLDNEWWIILESCSHICAWVDLNGCHVKVEKLVNEFKVMYRKVYTDVA